MIRSFACKGVKVYSTFNTFVHNGYGSPTLAPQTIELISTIERAH